MIYFLYGSDIGQSRKMLDEIIEEYRKRSGSGLGIHQFDAEEEDLGCVKEALRSVSLFTSKKLIVIKYLSLSSWDRAELYELLNSATGPGITVVFWDRELSKEMVSEMRPHCSKIKEFSSTEKKNPELPVFLLGDTFFASKKKGLRALLELLYLGYDDFNLFSYLSNYVRTLLTVRYYGDAGRPVPVHHRIHPFVIKKASAAVRSIPSGLLRQTPRRFFEEDHKIKIGLSKPKDSLFSLFTYDSGKARL